jgi:MoaA/NifB/PqqE/SkfB family radical SAM enzyme
MHGTLRHARSLFLKTRPIHLTFFVTARCNARCPFCFYEVAREAKGGQPELTREEVRRVARSLDPLLWVLFSGGEPFLREDLVELARIFHDTNRVGFLTFPTNGLLPEVIAERTEEVLRRCRESVVVVKLSLDGVGEDHDAVRGVPGGFQRWMHAYERLARLAERYPALELGVNTLFCSENQARMDGIVDFVRGLDGVRSHTLTMVRGDLRQPRYKDVDLSAYARATARLEERWAGRGQPAHRFAGAGLKAAQDRLQRRLIHRTLSERRRLVPCYAGRLNLVLTERGELHPCEERRDRSFGNVREADYDVDAMLRSERAARIQAEIADEGCFCSHECNFLTNILFNPALHPRLLRDWARLRLGRRGNAPAAGAPARPAAAEGAS